MLQHDAADESSIANGALSPCIEESNNVTSALWKNDVKDLYTRFWGQQSLERSRARCRACLAGGEEGSRIGSVLRASWRVFFMCIEGRRHSCP